MSFKALRESVCEANIKLVEAGLVTLTWGNVSGADRKAGVLAIKPSGVSYDTLKPDDIVLVSLDDGTVVDGNLKPSSDTPTHLVLCREFPAIGAVVHTHSRYATSWAQSEQSIPCMGTTHADFFYGSVPVTRRLTAGEIEAAYEVNTGRVIVECFSRHHISPTEIPAVLAALHGPFTWGASPEAAVENAIVLEEIAFTGLMTYELSGEIKPIPDALLYKHFLRKHGSAAYYGQR